MCNIKQARKTREGSIMRLLLVSTAHDAIVQLLLAIHIHSIFVIRKKFIRTPTLRLLKKTKNNSRL